jgi:hypothetical protein
MARTVYSATKTFDKISGTRVISVDAGTGSVVLAIEHGSGTWLDIETFSTDTAKVLDFGPLGATYRFTVTGDATYAL